MLRVSGAEHSGGCVPGDSEPRGRCLRRGGEAGVPTERCHHAVGAANGESGVSDGAGGGREGHGHVAAPELIDTVMVSPLAAVSPWPVVTPAVKVTDASLP